MNLLHVSASPRGTASDSLALAGAFLDSYRSVNPDVEVDHFDLHDGTLPPFGTDAANAKLTVFGGGTPSGAEAAAWDKARAVFERFAAADAYLFSVPMWNSGVPYVLKQWIDLITQPGWTFGFSPTDGYSGLVNGKKAAVVYVSGVYAPGVPPAFGVDYQSTFFNDWLKFVGITDISEVRFQPSILTATRDDDLAAALKRAAEAGSSF
ncbi:MAG: FMN-dependent NADH-azoreductase [Sporichthyaceae bacterium]